MNKKVVMTGTLGVMTPESLFQMERLLKDRDPEIEFQFLYDEPQEDETLIAAAKGATVLVTQFQFISDAVYQKLRPELRAVIAYGIGYNSANLPSATKEGVMVANIPNYCLEEVAVHAVALMLAMHRRFMNTLRWIELGKWSGGYKCIAPMRRFSKSTVGLYGFGRIARLVAKRLSGFGCRMIAYDAIVPPIEMQKMGVEPVDFMSLLEQSDYLSLHVPLLPSTERTFNREAFSRMKKTAVLINTARGGLLVPEALYDALVNGQISGAAIDAYTTEPPMGIEQEILKLPNVLSTPHVGYYSDDAFEDLMRMTADEIVHIIHGEQPENLLNPEALHAQPIS